jgi:hypothetical protein
MHMPTEVRPARPGLVKRRSHDTNRLRTKAGSVAVSLFVAGCVTSVAVLAQGIGPGPAAAPQEAKKVAEPAPKPAPTKAGDGSRKAARPVIAPVDVPATREVFQKAIVKKAINRVGQQNRAPLIQQFTNQARPLLRAELVFARNVCQLKRDELRKVNQDAQQMLDEMVSKLVDAQFQPRRPVQAKGRVINNLDAQQLLSDGVVEVMKRDLTAEQWSIYEAERQKRDENRKRITIRYFVDAIDREIYLSPEQRDRLESTFEANWESTWGLYLENHLYGNRYFPMTIDRLVTPVLSDAQKKVWQGVQKVGAYWGFAAMLGGFANDPDSLEIELGEPGRRAQNRNQAFDAMPMQFQEFFDGDAIIQGDVIIHQGVAPAVRVQRKMAGGVRKGGPKQIGPAAEERVEKAKD